MDLTSIDGINVMTAQTVIAEVGLQLSRFPTEAQFVNWLNLSPNSKITGGKVIGRDQRKVVNRAEQALREAAKLSRLGIGCCAMRRCMPMKERRGQSRSQSGLKPRAS